jgi:hypothetical protein
MEEPIPRPCRRLTVGTGALGSLPIVDEARRLLSAADSDDTLAILHVTC